MISVQNPLCNAPSDVPSRKKFLRNTKSTNARKSRDAQPSGSWADEFKQVSYRAANLAFHSPYLGDEARRKQRGTSLAFGRLICSHACFISSYPDKEKTPVQDCGCYDALCGCCCCKGEGCLCGFSTRSRCVKFCCIPFLLVLASLATFLFIPRSVDVVLAQDLFELQFDPESRYFLPQVRESGKVEAIL